MRSQVVVRVATAVALGLALLWPALARARHAVVVFGSTVRADGQPSASLERRLATALAAARSDPRALLVVSGGAVTGPAEGPAMARWLRARGIPRHRILVEPRARHTGENADLVVPILRRAGVDRVTLVSEQYHLRRARFHLSAALRAAGLELEVDTRAAPDGLRGPARLGAWLRESAKILRDATFRLRDRLRDPSRGSAWPVPQGLLD